TQAAADEPSPRSSGIRFTPWSATAGTMPPPTRAACAISFETMSVPSVGSSPAPCPSHVTPCAASVSTVTSFHRSRAKPKQSNPGPRLAEVAGTRAVSFTTSQAELSGDGRRVRRDGRGLRGAGDGPLRILEPVSGQHADHGGAPRELPVGVEVEQTGDARRARGLGEQA